MPINNNYQNQYNMYNQKQSNKIYVSGLQGARAYPTVRNSEMLLCDDTLDIIYDVETDFEGKKIVRVFDVSEHIEPPTLDTNALLERLNKLEQAVSKLSGGTDV